MFNFPNFCLDYFLKSTKIHIRFINTTYNRVNWGYIAHGVCITHIGKGS